MQVVPALLLRGCRFLPRRVVPVDTPAPRRAWPRPRPLAAAAPLSLLRPQPQELTWRTAELALLLATAHGLMPRLDVALEEPSSRSGQAQVTQEVAAEKLLQVVSRPEAIQLVVLGHPLWQGHPLLPGHLLLQGHPLWQGQPLLPGHLLLQRHALLQGQPLLQGHLSPQEGHPLLQGHLLLHGQPAVVAQAPHWQPVLRQWWLGGAVSSRHYTVLSQQH